MKPDTVATSVFHALLPSVHLPSPPSPPLLLIKRQYGSDAPTGPAQKGTGTPKKKRLPVSFPRKPLNRCSFSRCIHTVESHLHSRFPPSPPQSMEMSFSAAFFFVSCFAAECATDSGRPGVISPPFMFLLLLFFPPTKKVNPLR